MEGYLYILQSQKNNTYYIGSTSDVSRRLTEHNAGKSRYTKDYCPWSIVFIQSFESLAMSRKAEHWLKKQKSRELLTKIIAESSIQKKFS